MKISLVQCPCAFGTEMPSLGIAYLSSYLKMNNYNVSVLDLSIILYRNSNEKDKEYWKSSNGYCWYLKEVYSKLTFIDESLYNDCVNKILCLESDVIGFSIQSTSVLFTLEVIKRIKSKKPSQKIILGGPNCYNISGDDSDFKLHHGLEKYADVIVIGEGEYTLLNVLSRIKLGQALDDCKGIAIPKNDKWIFNGPALPIANLDELPGPDLDSYDLDCYTDKNALPVITSRGCIMRCVFCTDTYFWMTYRYRSSEKVVSEIIKMREKYHNGFVSFNDSLINGNYNNFVKMCDLLISKKVGIKWGGNCRVDKKIDLSMLRKMKESGCDYLILGLESGSNKILKAMRKGFTVKEASDFIHKCARVEILVEANWIVGFPGETEGDFMDTAIFISKHRGLIRRNCFATLTINQFSYLEKHKDEFGIVLNGPHLGLWNSFDEYNNFDLRKYRLRYLEDIENKVNKAYGVSRQVAD